MSLRYYLGKMVELTLTNNKVLVGKVTGFDDKYDNFGGFNSIEIDTGSILYDITGDKIKSIVLD